MSRFLRPTRADKIDAEAGEIAVNFDGREITYEGSELDSLVLATIHKAQASEWRAVILVPAVGRV